jgi:hypothetical protein
MSDFATGESIRLTLSGDQWIEIKKRLSTGEREDMLAEMSADGERINRREVRVARVKAYLLAWSLKDGQGQPVPMSPQLPDAERRDYIRNLDPDRFDEIHDAITAHEAAMTKAREAQKKILRGSPDVAGTSPSPSAPDGPLTTSDPSILMTTV